MRDVEEATTIDCSCAFAGESALTERLGRPEWSGRMGIMCSYRKGQENTLTVRTCDQLFLSLQPKRRSAVFERLVIRSTRTVYACLIGISIWQLTPSDANTRSTLPPSS